LAWEFIDEHEKRRVTVPMLGWRSSLPLSGTINPSSRLGSFFASGYSMA